MKVLVGEVLRPHGIRGEVLVRVHSEDPRRFAAGATLAVGPDPWQVRAARPHPSGAIVRFEGVGDRNEAEELRGALIFAPAPEGPAPEPDSFWEHQIVGLEVRDVGGRVLGHITRVLARREQDLWEVQTPAERVLMPAARAIVRSVDLGSGTVVIDPPPGLFDDE